MPMLPAYVDRLPTGSESGTFFALDLGGTNFRVRYVALEKGKDEIDTKSVQYKISKAIMTAPVEDLFDYMASKSVPFMRRFLDPKAGRPRIGFTFSFPMEQTGIASARLLRWTKGYSCPGGVGSDPVRLLKDAFARKGMEVDVPVLANDTVAVLAAGRYYHPDCRMGVILGTGTNAAYMERTARIARAELPSGTEEMAINTEWADFLGESLPTLPEDRGLDEASFNTGLQLYEKMISGMRLGEIVRRILVTLGRRGLLWGGDVPLELLVEHRIPTSLVSRLDDGRKVADARMVLTELGLNPGGCLSRNELQTVIEVCSLVGRRAARLSAAGMLAIMNLMGIDGSDGPVPDFTIAVDGGLFEKYASFRDNVGEALREVLGEEAAKRVALRHAGDGSGDGAAMLAAIAPASG